MSLHPLSIGVYYEMNYLLLSTFFPSRVNPLCKEIQYTDKQTGCHKSCLPIENGLKGLTSISIPLKSMLF